MASTMAVLKSAVSTLSCSGSLSSSSFQHLSCFCMYSQSPPLAPAFRNPGLICIGYSTFRVIRMSLQCLSKDTPSARGLSTAWWKPDYLRMSFILEAPKHLASRALMSPRARSFPVVSSSNILIHFPAPSWMSGRRETKVSRS